MRTVQTPSFASHTACIARLSLIPAAISHISSPDTNSRISQRLIIMRPVWCRSPLATADVKLAISRRLEKPWFLHRDALNSSPPPEINVTIRGTNGNRLLISLGMPRRVRMRSQAKFSVDGDKRLNVFR